MAINPGQAASRLSMMMCTFLDPIVFLAYRVLHLSHDMLPPLADYTKYLARRSFNAGVYCLSVLSVLIRSDSTWIPFPAPAGGISLGLLDYLSYVPPPSAIFSQPMHTQSWNAFDWQFFASYQLFWRQLG